MSLENLLWSVTEAIFRHNDPYQPNYPQDQLFQVVETLFRRHMENEVAACSRPAHRPASPPRAAHPFPSRLQASGGYLCSVASPQLKTRMTAPCVDAQPVLSKQHEYQEGRQTAVPLEAPRRARVATLPVHGGLRPALRNRRVGPPISLRLIQPEEAAG